LEARPNDPNAGVLRTLFYAELNPELTPVGVNSIAPIADAASAVQKHRHAYTLGSGLCAASIANVWPQ
jgi:hypothetical protein